MHHMSVMKIDKTSYFEFIKDSDIMPLHKSKWVSILRLFGENQLLYDWTTLYWDFIVSTVCITDNWYYNSVISMQCVITCLDYIDRSDAFSKHMYEMIWHF